MSDNFNHIGFSIFNNKLNAVEVVNENNGYLLKHVDCNYFNDIIDFENDKETKILANLQSAFDELLLKNSFSSKNVSFSLPSDLFYSIQVPYDSTLKKEDLEIELKWELSLLYPGINTQDILIQTIETAANSLTEIKTVIVMGISRKYLTLLNTFCNNNSLTLNYIDNHHFASDNSLFNNQPNLKDNLVKSIFVTDKKISYIIYLKRNIVFFKQFQLTNTLSLTDILLEEITDKKPFSIPNNIIDFTFISGNDFTKSKIGLINEKTGLNISLFNPFTNILPDDSLVNNPLYTENNFNFNSAAGMAYRIK